MIRCNRHDLRDRSLCHRCTRYQKAWVNHYESALACQPVTSEHAQHLLTQKRQHLKALRSIERDLQNLPAATTTIPQFHHFHRFIPVSTVSPFTGFSEEKS